MPVDELMNGDFVDIYLIPWGIKIATAVAIFVIGRWIAKLILNISERVMRKAKLDEMLIHFIGNILYTLLLAVVVLATLEQLGVKTTSAIAILGAAGLAVGLALQSSLSNFANGVMLIIFRPFKIGDFIEAGGTSGTVEKITIFSTVMRTGDNREIIVPNGQIYGGTIINFSARPTRRIDMVFGIGYNDDIKKARELMMDIIKQDARILSDPEPAISLAELADNSVNLNVRPWVNSGDYWAVRSDLLENIKNAFDANGISIPYPQRDVHLHQVS
ncbi:MAG: mechanosensitive ion channel [Gammaproteobacteria bacterium]|nr:mechanosensitive ion channel [Gammaproteobacteria bacterium]MDH5593242.1 mechanosensitive ion channel [Gammaproteobacteria bacterium]MDH5613469.1 mechanosensitive ion channel [Gammaproteobacteria bacterium]